MALRTFSLTWDAPVIFPLHGAALGSGDAEWGPRAGGEGSGGGGRGRGLSPAQRIGPQTQGFRIGAHTRPPSDLCARSGLKAAWRWGEKQRGSHTRREGGSTHGGDRSRGQTAHIHAHLWRLGPELSAPRECVQRVTRADSICTGAFPAAVLQTGTSQNQ